MRLDILWLASFIFLNYLPILGVEELAFFDAKVSQISWYQPVLILSALRIQLDPISSNPIHGVDNNQEVAATDLVLHAPGYAKLDQNSLRQLLLNLDKLLDKVVTFSIEFFVNLEYRLLNFLWI